MGSHLFPHAEYLGQQLFLLVIYCYFIFNGSKFIAHGCDLLREVYGSGIVGSLLIPVLGAVPDGIIIIFSILGEKETEEALAESISVGVGQLVGATCMLITIPLCVSIFLGSRALDENGVAMSEYKPISRGSNKLILKPVLPKGFSLWSNGITSLPSTPRSVMWMLVTACTYLVIQIPALFFHRDKDHGAAREHIYMLFALIVATFLFLAYLYTMAKDSDNDELVEERRSRGNRFLNWTKQNRNLISSLDPVTLFNLLDGDQDGFLDAEDIETGFKILGFTDISNSDALAIFNLADQDNNILIDLEEWTAFVREFILTGEKEMKSDYVKTKEKLETKLQQQQNNNNNNNLNKPPGLAHSSSISSQQDLFLNTSGSHTIGTTGGINMPNGHSTSNNNNNKLNALSPGGLNPSSMHDESRQLWNLQATSPDYTTSSNIPQNTAAKPQRIPTNNNNNDVESQYNSNTTYNYQPLSATYHGTQHQLNSTIPMPGSSISLANATPKFMRLEQFPVSSSTAQQTSFLPSSMSQVNGNAPLSSSATGTGQYGSYQQHGGDEQDGHNVAMTNFGNTPQRYASNLTANSALLATPRGGSNIAGGRGTTAGGNSFFANRKHMLESRTNLLSDYHQQNHGITEEVQVVYRDENRVEEELDAATKQTPPHIRPDVMTAVLRWYLDPTNQNVALLYVGTKLRYSLHLWAKRTGKLGHYSFEYEGERVLKLIKIDPKTHLPVHTRNNNNNAEFPATRTRQRTYSRVDFNHPEHDIMGLGDRVSSSTSINVQDDDQYHSTSHNHQHRHHHNNNSKDHHVPLDQKPLFENDAYHQNVWENLEVPRWCYASPEIYKWFIHQYALQKQQQNNAKNTLLQEHTKESGLFYETGVVKKMAPKTPIIGKKNNNNAMSNSNYNDESDSSSSSSSDDDDGSVLVPILLTNKNSATNPTTTTTAVVAPPSDRDLTATTTESDDLDGLPMPLLLDLFKHADKNNQKALSFDMIHQFCQEWGIYRQNPSITKRVAQVIFYNIDNDYDRALHVFDFRTFLEEFVKLPTIHHNSTKLHKKHPYKKFQHKNNQDGQQQQQQQQQPFYSQNEVDKWFDDCEDINDEMNQREQKEVEYYCFCSHGEDYLPTNGAKKDHGSGDDEDDDLTPRERLAKQERFHKLAGFGTLLLGTTLILIFSDPLIEIIASVGSSSGVPAFYISFSILPFVSNSSELITSLVFAREKTATSISLTLSSLYGAAIMNNTFCTAIFLFLLYMKGLPWVYTAECLTVILVQLIVGLICARQTLRQIHGVICALIFPLAVFFIWFLENVGGMKDY